MKILKIKNLDIERNQNVRMSGLKLVWYLYFVFSYVFSLATWRMIWKPELIKEKIKIVFKCFPCWFMFGVLPKIIIGCLISTYSMQLIDSQLNQVFIFGYILFGFLISDLLRI